MKMLTKKEISFSTQGQRADLGPLQIQRILTNRKANAVEPFVRNSVAGIT